MADEARAFHAGKGREFFAERAIKILRAVLIEAAQTRIHFDEESVLGPQP